MGFHSDLIGFYSDLMGYEQDVHSGYVKIAIDHDHLEFIVSFPSFPLISVIFHIVV